MFFGRTRRRWLCGWLIAQLLFAQLAMAAYACPKLDPQAAPAAAMSAMPGCNGDMAAMDPEQPQLCKAHCEAGGQSVNTNVGLDGVPPPMLLGARWMRVLDAAASQEIAAFMPPALAAGPPAGTPPLYLSLLVLRN